jgi:hypothetical protein
LVVGFKVGIFGGTVVAGPLLGVDVVWTLVGALLVGLNVGFLDGENVGVFIVGLLVVDEVVVFLFGLDDG